MSSQFAAPEVGGFFTARGFGRRMGFGAQSALIVVDMLNAFTDPDLPLGSAQDHEIKVIQGLLPAFREAGKPILFLGVSYEEPDCADAGVWRLKNAGVSTLAAGTHGTELDSRLDRARGEPLLYRRYASGFFGTDLATRLTTRAVDTVVIVGCTTSGCVRATAVDAMQYGFRPVVVSDAVADRSATAHDQSLFDIEAKYGDVVSSAEVVAHLRSAGPVTRSEIMTNGFPQPQVRDYRMLAGGQLRPAADGATIDAHNPVTGELLGTVPMASAEDVDQAVRAASAAFPAWRDLPALKRATALRAAADVLEAHGEELARLDTLDNGSPIREMRRDIGIAAFQLRYFAGLALEVGGKTAPPESGSLGYTLRQPFGVVGRIVAFNHPLLFAASRIAGPLVVGNTVLLKPSEHTSLSALRLGELLTETFPPGVLSIVTGAGDDAGDAIVGHPEVRRLGFTGSAPTGRRLQRRAAESVVKTVTLELGGKNPIIVFPDADRDAAVEGALRGMNFTWQGQSCGSTSRLYVHGSMFDEITSALAERMDALRQGDPCDEATQVGAIAFPEHHARVMKYIEMGRADDRVRLLAGGGPPDDEGLSESAFIRPTLFACKDDDLPIVQEEIFGPVLVALPFDDYDEVIARANATGYGLTASVWTTDLATAVNAARDLEAGYVWINESSRHIPGAPFGGFKDSGVGREEDIEELLSYTQVKNVYMNV